MIRLIMHKMTELEEELQITCYMIMQLKFLVIYNMMKIKENLLQSFTNFDEKSERRDTKAVTNTPPKQELTGTLSKLIIRKFQKRKVYSLFMDNTWVSNLPDM